MVRRRRIYEGNAKVIYEGTEAGTLVQYFKDDARIGSGSATTTITGKGVLNNRISEHLMRRLSDINIPTHLIRRLNMREQLIHEVEIIPVEIVVRNIAAGTICQRLGIDEGMALPRGLVEYFYKNDKSENTLVNEEHITAFDWATPDELNDILTMTLRINDFLMGLFYGVGIRLIDLQLEFGRLWQGEELKIVLADEISPDTCRLWDLETDERLDRDRARLSISEATKGYQEVARRLKILPKSAAVHTLRERKVN